MLLRSIISSSLVVLFLGSFGVSAQSDDTPSTYCDFQDGNEITVRYNKGGLTKAVSGPVYTIGGAPMTLFTQTPLKVEGKDVPIGAYSLYVIPGKKSWTLVVNKSVNAGNGYDPAQDIARTSMEVANVDQAAKELRVSFAHLSPKQCNLRIDFEKTAAFGDIFQK